MSLSANAKLQQSSQDNLGNLKNQPDPNDQLRARLKLPATPTIPKTFGPDEQLPATEVEAAVAFCRGALEQIGVAPTERYARDVASRLLTSMREGLTLKDAETIVEWAVVIGKKNGWPGYRDLTNLLGAKHPVYLASARAWREQTSQGGAPTGGRS